MRRSGRPSGALRRVSGGSPARRAPLAVVLSLPLKPKLFRPLRLAARKRVLPVLLFLLETLFLALPQRWAVGLGGRLGRWIARIDGSRRRFAEAQLSKRLGVDRREARRLATANYGELGRSVAEILRPPRPDAVKLEGLEVIERALAEGRGALFVSAHFGSWELLARRVVQQGFRAAVIVRAAVTPELEAWLSQRRERAGLEIIHRGHPSSPGSILRTLRQGGLLGVLLDQSTRVPSIPVPFLGALAPTPLGPARLALRRDLPVLLGLIERNPHCKWRHTIRIERIALPPPGALDARAERLTEALSARIAEAVRRRPDHWVWFHDRWGAGAT